MSTLLHVSVPSIAVIDGAFDAGYDGVIIDLQHGEIGLDAACALTRQVSRERLDGVWARVPSIDSGSIGRLLDAGVRSIVAPTVESPEEAAALVAAVKYPPQGRRSLGPSRTGLYEGAGDPPVVNDWVRAVAQIETRAGVEAAKAIAATPGLDSIYLGPADLAVSYGLPVGDMLAPESPIRPDLLAVIEAARAAGLTTGSFVGDPAAARAMIQSELLDYVGLGVDLMLFAGAARARISTFRSNS